jgi:hypothetical protein
LNKKVIAKKLLAQMGLGLARIIGIAPKKRVSPLVEERESFERDMKEQFLKLKEKGLSIPIFTL